MADPTLDKQMLPEVLGKKRIDACALTILLRREGWRVNHKRVHRLYREEGLQVHIERRKKLASQPQLSPRAAMRIDERSSMDFVSDGLTDGRRIPFILDTSPFPMSA